MALLDSSLPHPLLFILPRPSSRSDCRCALVVVSSPATQSPAMLRVRVKINNTRRLSSRQQPARTPCRTWAGYWKTGGIPMRLCCVSRRRRLRIPEARKPSAAGQGTSTGGEILTGRLSTSRRYVGTGDDTMWEVVLMGFVCGLRRHVTNTTVVHNRYAVLLALTMRSPPHLPIAGAGEGRISLVGVVWARAGEGCAGQAR